MATITASKAVQLSPRINGKFITLFMVGGTIWWTVQKAWSYIYPMAVARHPKSLNNAGSYVAPSAGIFGGPLGSGGTTILALTINNNRAGGYIGLFVPTGTSLPTIIVGQNPSAIPLKDGIQGVSYSENFDGMLGVAPYTFTITSGALPTGLSLNSTTGVVSGTPTTPGVGTFTIRATDNNGATGDQQFSITISPAIGSSGSSGGAYVYVV